MRARKSGARRGQLDEEGEDFYDDLDSDDDLFGRDKASSDRPAAPAKATYATLPRSVKVGVVAALVIGVIAGIYVGGGGSATDDPFAGVEMPDGHPDISQMGGNAFEEDDGLSIAELAAQVARDPGDVGARLDLGVAYFNARELEKAAAQWEAVLADDPQNVPALYNMGFYYMSMDEPDLDAARESWEKVVAINPDSVEAGNVQMHLAELADASTGN